MALSSDRSEMNLSFGENVTGISVDDDFVKLITNEIVEILQLDEDEMGGQIVKDLLKNGRQSLVKYKDDIVPKVYNEVMNGNDTKLMSSLKKYFRQKWEIQYGSSNSWFISFLKQYENGENHDIYESILTRTAQYGNKYMKDCPLLSIVLQLLFENIDDNCLQETNNVFDDLWMTITNDGLKSIPKYSEYIAEKVMNEQLEKDSVLFEALREYYRPSVLLSLTQSNIANRKNLYELALDDVVEHGWLSDMKSVEGDMAPRRFQMLLTKLRFFNKKQRPSQNEDPNGPIVPPLEIDLPPGSTITKHATTRNEKQEPSIEVNQLQSTVSTQNVTSMEETSSDTKSVTNVLDHATDANIENTDIQQDENERDDDESNDSHDSKNGLGNTNNMLVCSKDAIFVNGLPKTMSTQYLSDKLRDVFSTCGDIKIYEKTNKPDIWLFPQRGNKSEHNGTAMLRFEKEESAMIAVGIYNGKQIPALNNARISVRFNRMKHKGVDGFSADTPRQKRSESNRSSNSGDERTVHDIPNTTVLRKDTIYITGLPTNMPEQYLFDTLWDEFRTMGPIKIDNKINKPCIHLFKEKSSMSELNGTATVTFESEESVIKAIENYNTKQVSSLNDSQLCVQRSKTRPVRSTPLPKSHSQTLLQSSPVRAISGPERQPDGPVSIFWDIENVAIPAANNAFDILLKLRKRLMEDRKLREGTIKTYYCNIHNIPPNHRTDLHHANVLVQHIERTKYGAVDREIHKDLQRFIEQHKTPATVVLISGDIDFIKDLSDLRFRHGHYTIVIHNPQAKEQLLKTANEVIPWEAFVEKKYPNIPKSKDNLRRTYSPMHNLDKTRPSTSPAKRPSLTELNVNESAANTDNNVLESTSTIANQPKREKPRRCSRKPDASKNEERCNEKHHKNESKLVDQPQEPLLSLTRDSLNAAAVDGNSVVSSANETQKLKKKNKPLENVNAFSCSMCDKKFPTDTARIQHEQDKHKVGTLVEVFSATSTDDFHSHSQSSGHDNQPHINLIAFADDDDFDPLQPNLPMTTTTETSRPVAVNDDDSSTSELFFELNDSVRLPTNSLENEEPPNIDIAKHSEENN